MMRSRADSAASASSAHPNTTSHADASEAPAVRLNSATSSSARASTAIVSFARAERSPSGVKRSEEHTSELQSRPHLVCRLLLEKKNKNIYHLRLVRKLVAYMLAFR